MTTMGMKEGEAEEVASLIARALRGHDRTATEKRIRELAASFRPYPNDFSGHV
jgi:glycine/serine hydroxymethyltransferase